ncbi:MAG: chorismate synthase [Abditibacteriota bacterium]|nr:chorismate synthase [Abditibacteriota bacterium]
MKNTFGNSVTLTLLGESHGPGIGAVLDGLAPGIEVSEEAVAAMLEKRRPAGAISTSRRERDDFRILSGVFRGKTTGTPLAIIIPNSDTKSDAYEALRHTPRPGHADLTAEYKYRGFQDYRGGGHFSGRLTAALAAAGGILLPALRKKGILIGTHISVLGGGSSICDSAFPEEPGRLEEALRSLEGPGFPTLSPDAEKAMTGRILEAKQDGDSVGGILETCITGIPAGTGEPWFDTLEGLLAHILFSVPAVKGVEFGEAFSLIGLRGSGYNDAFYMADDGRIRTKTNHNGGVNGGIANGMPILFRTQIKPTPSVFKTQETVDTKEMKNTALSLSGRHDPAIIHRAPAVVDSAAALVAADLLALRFGTDYLGE